MKLIRITLTLFIVLLVIVALPTRVGGKKDKDLNAVINQAAQRLNMSRPNNSDMHMMQASPEGSRLKVVYKLVRVSLQELDVDGFNHQFSQSLAKACHEKDTLQLMNLGGEVQFDYVDRDNALVSRFLLRKDNCNATTTMVKNQPIAVKSQTVIAPTPEPQPLAPSRELTEREQLEAAVNRVGGPLVTDTAARNDMIARTDAYMKQGMNRDSAVKLAVADYEQAHPRK